MVDHVVPVAMTTSGPLYRVEGTAATCEWTVGLHVLSELARRAMDPRADVKSSIAADLGGGEAFLAHCQMLGSFTTQARQGGTAGAALVGATLLAYLDAGHDPIGLEGLFASVANRVTARVSPALSVPLLRATHRVLRESPWSATMPTYVVHSGGAVSTLGPKYTQSLDEPWLKWALAKARRKAKLTPLPSKDIAKARKELAKSPIPGLKDKVDDIFGGDGWEKFAVDDLGADPTAGLGSGKLGPLAGLGKLKDKDAFVAEGAKLERPDWSEDPVGPDDISRPDDLVSSKLGDAVQSVGKWMQKAGNAEYDNGGNAALAGVAVVVGGIVTPAAPLTMSAGALMFVVGEGVALHGVAVAIAGKAVTGIGQVISMPTPTIAVDPDAQPAKPKKDPFGHLWVAYPHLKSAKAVKKEFASGAGYGKGVPKPSDVDDTNRPTFSLVPVGDFAIVDPLKDPIDMMLPDGGNPLHEPPKHVTVEQLHPKVYYVGPGTTAGIVRLAGGTLLRT